MQNYQEQSPAPLRSLLARLLSGWSVGAGKTPTIYGDNALSPATVQRGNKAMQDTALAAQNRAAASAPPMPMPPTDAEADALDMQRNGPMTDAALPASIRSMGAAQGYVAPAGTLGGMDIAEGENARIDDDTRARALAWALRNSL